MKVVEIDDMSKARHVAAVHVDMVYPWISC